MLRIFVLAILIAFNSPLHAKDKLKVVTTLPELAEVVRSVGGERVEVEALLRGSEDPHFLDASPNFIRKVASADAVCIMGLELEVGWIPKVLARSANARVQPGGMGYCDTGKAVQVTEKPTGTLDRSMGDVHPFGNPHFNLSPKALAEASDAVVQVLSALSPEDSVEFKARQETFKAKMDALRKSIDGKLASAKALSKTQPIVIEYHREFTYFFELYGVRSFGAIEDLPGVPPSAKRLAEVSAGAKASKVKLAVGAHFSPEKHLKKFGELSQVPFKKFPTMVQLEDHNLDSIEKLQNYLADSIAKSL